MQIVTGRYVPETAEEITLLWCWIRQACQQHKAQISETLFASYTHADESAMMDGFLPGEWVVSGLRDRFSTELHPLEATPLQFWVAYFAEEPNGRGGVTRAGARIAWQTPDGEVNLLEAPPGYQKWLGADTLIPTTFERRQARHPMKTRVARVGAVPPVLYPLPKKLPR